MKKSIFNKIKSKNEKEKHALGIRNFIKYGDFNIQIFTL